MSVLVATFCIALQRMQEPSFPKSGKMSVNGEKVSYKLPRVGVENQETTVRFPAVATPTSGASTSKVSKGAFLYYRTYPLVQGEEYTQVPMKWSDGDWSANLPARSMGEKLAYFVEVEGQALFAEEPLIVQYQGQVSLVLVILYRLLMFFAMFFALMTLIATFCNQAVYKRYSLMAIIGLALGGLALGAWIQHLLSGAYQVKVSVIIALAGFIAAWGVALFSKKNNNARWAVFVAAILSIAATMAV